MVRVRRHSQPTSRTSLAGAILGIVLIAFAVLVCVPVAMNLPASWPGLLVAVTLAGAGIALLKKHAAHHRQSSADTKESTNVS
jgi:nitrogen fixation protein FixH